MRIGDIYFRQMDKPDRDYVNTHGEESTATCCSSSPIPPWSPGQAAAPRSSGGPGHSGSEIAAFYATRANLAAAIARLPDRRRHLPAVQPHG